MDTASGEYGPGDLRVSDADRDRAIGELSRHFQAGRLTLEEFDDRSEQAVRAKTGRDLADLFTDLPAAQTETLDIWDPRVPQDTAGVPEAGRHVTAARVIARAAGIAGVVIVVSLLARGGLAVHAGIARHGFTVPVPLLIVLFFLLRVVWRRPRRRSPLPDDPPQDR